MIKKLFFATLVGLLAFCAMDAQTISLTTVYETNKAKKEEFALKIMAPKGATFYIDYGDGTGTHSAIGSGVNQTYFYSFADMDKNSTHRIKIWGAQFKEFLVVSNRKVTEIQVEDCTELLKFSCANSLLKKLDLSGCTKLESLVCNSNEISSLRVPGSLRSIDFSRNSLAIEDFPKKTSQMSSYKYGPMRPIALSSDKISGLRVDLTHMLTFRGGNGTKSTFRWYYLTGSKNIGEEAALIAPQSYTERDGVFTFNQQPEGKIYCVVDNSELPNLHNIADKYGILPIGLSGEDRKLQSVQAAFFTDKYTTENLTFNLTLSAGVPNSKCLIAWGDGVIEELTLGLEPQEIKHHFLDAKVDKTHHIQIECAHLKRLEIPEVEGFLGFDKKVLHSPLEEIVVNNNRVQELDFSTFAKAKKILANACFAQTVLLPQSVELQVLSLRSSLLGEIDLRNYPQLRELNLSSNKLLNLDLSTLAELRKADISHNKIRELLLPQNASFVEFNCAYNAIPMYQLPPKGKMQKYIYAPQAAFEIPKEMINGTTVDLSKFAKLQGISDKEEDTQFVWLHATDESQFIVKGLMYDEKDGVFTFKFEEPLEIFCTMTSAAFPDLTLGKNSYRTQNVRVGKKDNGVESIQSDQASIFVVQGNLLMLQCKISGIVQLLLPTGEVLFSQRMEEGQECRWELPRGIYFLKVGNQLSKVYL